MYNFDQAPSIPQSPVPPALADLMQVASMQTPEGQPTVAAQYAAKAQQAMAPQMPQGMPQGMPSAGPSMQGIAQNVARGNEVQATQQQQQQQAMQQMMQQMLQQQQGRDNAMRFGVAAAPGAQTVRMAEGGIVGYAEGNLTSERLARIAAEQAEEEARTRAGGRFDPRTPEEAREMAQRRAAAQARLNTPAATPELPPAAAAATEGRGVGSLLRRVGGRLLGPAAALYPVYEALKTPESRAETEDFFRGVLGFGPANREAPPYSNEGRINTIDRALAQEQENAGVEGRAYPAGSTLRSGIGQTADQAVAAAVAAAQRDMQPSAPSRAGIPTLQAPSESGIRASDADYAAAQRAISSLETTRTAPADIVRKVQEQQAAYAPFLRAMGVDPDQYKKDLATSEERKARRLSGLAALEAQSQEARSGTNRMIEFLAGGAGRVLPGALGQQHVNMLRRDLAENERFLNARERIMEAEDTIQASIREKRRAEVMGDLKAMETAEIKDREARNAQRIAQADLSKELGKALDSRIEKALDRQTQVAIENVRAQAQREATRAQQEGNLESRRANLLANLNKTEEAAFAKIDDQFNKRTAMLMVPGAKRTPEQERELQDAVAERDLAKAAVRKRLGETRQEIMSMGGSQGGAQGGGGIKVERVK